ncbi:hypothetical protein PMIN06_009485 [Paraphaeosphaeria minitans]
MAKQRPGTLISHLRYARVGFCTTTLCLRLQKSITMPLAQFANQTDVNCTAPLLDLATFSKSGGYAAGRYCGLGSFEDGTTCCFPCPIQDWLYKPNWEDHLRIPNYLSVLSVTLCLFLMLSFAVLPPEATYRHYLSVGLLFPVLFISLSFAIPVTTDPDMCFDAITPHNMHSSQSCAWTGSLVILGGVGSVVWVFLRSLWLHIRIFWEKDPGTRFMLGSIMFGTAIPLICLIAVLSATGLSYRMGQTCLPNHEHAIVTFWIWLIIFASLAFLLQTFTSGYCFYVYVRSLRRVRRESAIDSFERSKAKRETESWCNVRKLFLLQWRNILVSVFVITGSISFFIVFWTQDGKLGRVFNDPNDIMAVKTWIICQIVSMGDKQECRKYVQDFTVDQVAVLVSLIMASVSTISHTHLLLRIAADTNDQKLVGISIFILLFHTAMLQAWLALFRRLYHRALHRGPPPSPQLTSLADADIYQPLSPHKFTSIFRTNTITRSPSSKHHSTNTTLDAATAEPELSPLENRPSFELNSAESFLLSPPTLARLDTPSRHSQPSQPSSRAETPTPHPRTYHPTNVRLSQIQPTSPLTDSYTPSRSAPLPPQLPPSDGVANAAAGAERGDAAKKSGLGVRRTPSKVRGRISAPIPASFVHVEGAFLGAGYRGVDGGKGLGVRGVGVGVGV